MTLAVIVVFFLVYLGMILGGLPFLQLDRTGVALLGAIALIAIEAVTPEQAVAAVHVPDHDPALRVHGDLGAAPARAGSTNG